MSIFNSRSAAETGRIGRMIGGKLRTGDVVALLGELGAGKTVLVKGIAAGLGVRRAERVVTSPTFALIHEYAGREKIYHMDWYRLRRVEGEDALLAEECFRAKGICLVEWAGRGRGILPEKRMEIRMKPMGANKRRIEIVMR